ncbi:histidine kinase [Pseudactinotalea sp. Z1732]|uniref:histidine kinase n=1 Tax=Pseudactinotalea sp. Z1732 TaxID=3413026 RepID=UPI003C7E2BFD
MFPTRAAQVDARYSAVQGWLLDTVLAISLFATLAAMISANLGSDRGPQVVPYLWALMLGSLMLVRRRRPLVVLGITVLSLFIYYAAGYPVVGLSVPAVAALFSAAEFGRGWWAIGAAGLLLVVGYGVRLAEGQDVALLVGYELANDVLLMAAAIALGTGLRLRNQLRENSARLLWATEERERALAQAAITTERADIARELHDSLGHQGTVISMHTNIARESMVTHPETARDALEVVQKTNGAMMSELRRTVRTLQRREPSPAPATLVDLQRSLLAHLPIDVDTEITLPGELPRHLEATAYRIIQESLTNVVKHSEADAARIAVTTGDGQVRIVICDSGPSRRADTGAGGPGYGIRGMRERAVNVGGHLTAQQEDNGFVVRAHLPLDYPPTRPDPDGRVGGTR